MFKALTVGVFIPSYCFSPDSLPQWLCDYPVTIIQFLFFLYQNMLDFKPVFMSGEVLTALAGTLFPRGPGSETSSCASSPVDEVIKSAHTLFKHLHFETEMLMYLSYNPLTL